MLIWDFFFRFFGKFWFGKGYFWKIKERIWLFERLLYVLGKLDFYFFMFWFYVILIIVWVMDVFLLDVGYLIGVWVFYDVSEIR